jgi:ATP-binding cassette subfamily F protein 3
MIQLSDVFLDVGTRTIFEHLTCIIGRNDRIGVIGRNGAGKSTFLKLIARLAQPTAGQISIEKEAKIAYLPQEELLVSTEKVFDEAFASCGPIAATDKKIAQLEHVILSAAASQEQLQDYADAQALAQTFDRYKAVQLVQETLAGLGFTQQMMQQPVDELSTGWKMRLALAKLLLTPADFYLFDEPTNHLDLVTQHWFLRKLQSLGKGYLLVSHDRAYLDLVCTTILEIERGRAKLYQGNFTNYLVQKEQHHAIASSTRARQERELARKQATVDRFRAGNRARQAQNIQKQIERVELVEVDSPLPTIHVQFPQPSRSGSVVLKVHNLGYGFTNKLLFEHAAFEVHRGERVALVAANGVGKSTLINCIAGTYKPLHGKVTFGHAVTKAFFEQDQARALNSSKSIYDEVRDACALPTDGEIRAALGSFLFSGDDIYKKIGVLSGGEKNRVAMVKMLLQRANFLILDEPTNHLDLYAKDILRQALQQYEGTILFVSHDQDFVSRVATRIIELRVDGVYDFPGTYDEYCALKYQSPSSTAVIKTRPVAPTQSVAAQQLHALKKEVVELERTIARLERDEAKAVAVMAEHLYGSPEYSKALQRYTLLSKELAVAHTAWEQAVRALDSCMVH